MHGVRQLSPSEVFASAPGGSDSIVSETLAARIDMLGTQSQLGIELEHPATIRTPATALTRTRMDMRENCFPGKMPRQAYEPGLAGAIFRWAQKAAAAWQQSFASGCTGTSCRRCETRPNACRRHAPVRRSRAS